MKNLSFIIVDDSELDCFIATKTIRQLGEKGSIASFVQPRETLDYISKTEVQQQSLTVVLLDIIMPVMSGFEFVAEFDKLPADIRNHYHIIALTSSMNKKYTSRVAEFPTIKGMIEKPITATKFREFLHAIGSPKTEQVRV